MINISNTAISLILSLSFDCGFLFPDAHIPFPGEVCFGSHLLDVLPNAAQAYATRPSLIRTFFCKPHNGRVLFCGVGTLPLAEGQESEFQD